MVTRKAGCVCGFPVLLGLLDARLQAIRSEGSVREVRLSTSQHAAGFYQRFGFVTKLIVPGGFAPGIDRCDMVLALI
ncbi:hypothetical protein [Nevskia ramosa]|uniref:hypothetical protein n=1 Tax=Nevskia ramosa TaxID=64002 RepID=UPI003D0CA859